MPDQKSRNTYELSVVDYIVYQNPDTNLYNVKHGIYKVSLAYVSTPNSGSNKIQVADTSTALTHSDADLSYDCTVPKEKQNYFILVNFRVNLAIFSFFSISCPKVLCELRADRLME